MRTSVDRKTLYDQVWSVPGSRLASLYRISDVALAKTCKQFDIPRPPRGYWARVAAGQRVKKPPLPHPQRAHDVVYELGWEMSDDSVKRLAEDNPPVASAPPAAATSEVHPLAALVDQRLSSGTPATDGRITTEAPAPHASVSPAVRPRAVAILSTLFYRWEARGGSVVVTLDADQTPAETRLSIGEDWLAIRLEEVVDESKPLTDASRLTKRLALYIAGDDRRQLKRRWWDTSSQRLERHIGPLVEAVAAALDDKRLERLDAECVQRQKDKVAALRKTADRDASREFYMRQELMQKVDRWVDCQRVRGYLAAIKSAIDSRNRRPTDVQAFENWFEWATKFADSLDPIENGPLPEGDPPPHQNPPATDLDLTSATRATVARLGVPDADALWKRSQDAVRDACDGKFGTVWNEITRVLEGLGYDVSRREQASEWW